MLKVDVFMPKGRPFDREALRRVRPESLEEGADSRKYLLASPEDVCSPSSNGIGRVAKPPSAHGRMWSAF
jgi:hypothetical protein